MSSDKENEDPRYYGLLDATVVDNADPEGLGRVRLKIPGIIEPASDWAWPRGGGEAQRGIFDVPDKGADVVCQFINGDPHGRIVYERGHYGKPSAGDEVPTPVKAVTSADRPKLRAIEGKRYVVWMDERPGHEMLRIEDKQLSEDTYIELDGNSGVTTVAGVSAVRLKAIGSLFIDAADIQIGGRKLIKNGKPIQ